MAETPIIHILKDCDNIAPHTYLNLVLFHCKSSNVYVLTSDEFGPETENVGKFNMLAFVQMLVPSSF